MRLPTDMFNTRYYTAPEYASHTKLANNVTLPSCECLPVSGVGELSRTFCNIPVADPQNGLLIWSINKVRTSGNDQAHSRT